MPRLFAATLAAAWVGLLASRLHGQVATAAGGRALTLLDVLDATRSGHPVVEAAKARARAAAGTRTTMRSFANPVLSYDVENASFPNGKPIIGMDRETMTTAMVPLADIYQRGARVRRADADVRAVEADARAVQQQLALDAARTYFRTAVAQTSADAARDLTAWLDSVVAYNRARVEQGAAAEADLIRAELERDRAAADATMKQADLARIRADLATFLVGSRERFGGIVAVDSTPLTLEPARDVAFPPSGPGVTAAALSRYDVRAAHERLTAASAGVSSERSMIVRDFAATLGTKRSGGMTSMVAGLSVPIPLFNPNRGEIARATAERDAAAFELAARERSARAELTGAYDAARLLTDRAVQLTRVADGRPPFLVRADEARRLALDAYREGAVSLLQVIDAARAWNEARVMFYQTLYAQHESVALLLAARGDDLLSVLPSLIAQSKSPR